MEDDDDGRRWKKADESEREEHSRFAFFDVCIFVTASEGEELIVDIRHGGGCCRWTLSSIS